MLSAVFRPCPVRVSSLAGTRRLAELRPRVKDLQNHSFVELHASDSTIAVGNAGDYSHVHASVVTGDLEAAPFGESHSGVFRSFEKSGRGKYRLHAPVGAGDLTLR